MTVTAAPDVPVPGRPGWTFGPVDRERVWDDSIDGRTSGWYTTINVHDDTPGVSRSATLIHRDDVRFLTDSEIIARAQDAIDTRAG